MRQLARAFLLVRLRAVVVPGVRLPRPPQLLAALAAIPVIIFFLSAQSRLQASDFGSLSGVVVDSTLSEPVGGATVTLLPDGETTITTSDGRFRFQRVTPGYKKLEVSSVFHHRREAESFLVRAGEQLEFTIDMVPLVKIDAPQTVTASREQLPGRITYHQAELQHSGADDVGEFLQLKGVHIQTDGRTQYVSLRGALPNTVLILVDGIVLNPDGSAVDLRTIPLESVERVEVYETGAAARFGANALGGAVNLISRQDSRDDTIIEASGRTGSFGLRGGAVTLSSPAHYLRGRAYYDYEETENDYTYEHPHLGEQTRENHASRRYSVYGSFRPAAVAQLTMSLRLTDTHLGIPGAVYQETGPGAVAKHDSRLFSLNYQSSDWQVRGSYHELEQRYKDPSAFIVYDNHFTQIAREIAAQWSRRITDWLRLESGADYSSESFFNSNLANSSQSLPRVSRESQSFRAGATLEKNLAGLDARLAQLYRWDNVEGDSRVSPYVGASLQYGDQLRIGANTAYSEAYRLPPIDALFWQGDVFAVGNPELRAETSVEREAGVSLEIDTPVQIAVAHNWFEKDLDDLIIWRRQFDGKYKPVNLSRANYHGSEFRASISALDDKLAIDYSRNAVEAINQSAESGYAGNEIPFRPDRVETFVARAVISRLTVRYRLSYTGERYIREANTKMLPSYTLHDLKLELGIRTLERDHTVRFEVLNLFDERYELLERMPMPPRSFRLELEVSI